MTKKTAMRTAVAVFVAGGLLLLSGCTSSTDPDEVGLYYKKGSIDGTKFDHCTKIGGTDDYEWNNEIVYLPASLRQWNIAAQGGDTDIPITVSTQPVKDVKTGVDQPGGVPVKVWAQTNFFLNSYCDTNGGPVRDFWEKIGRRYKADTPEGWREMVQRTIVPPLTKATGDVLRAYKADDLVANAGGVRATAQREISAAFAAELKRATGGDFFCGPTFNRRVNECPPVEMLIVDIDYANDGIQQARDEKQRQIELGAALLAEKQAQAAALLAEAKGKADAAAELAKLYANPAWVRLQDTILKTQALIEACRAAKECRLVVGADGTLIMS